MHAVRDLDGVGRGQLRDRDGERRLAVDARDAGDRVRLLRDGRRHRAIVTRRAWTASASRARAAAPAISSTDVELRAGLHREGLVVLGDRRRPGTARRSARARRVIACCVKPAAASSAWSGVIVTRWPTPPTICAALTPSTSSMSGTTDASSSAWIVACVVVAGHGELDDREVVDARRDDLRVDVLGQLALDAVDRLRDLLLGGREVGAVGEGRLDDRGVRRARRGRRLEPRDTLDRGLDRGRDVVARRPRARRPGRSMTIESCGNSIDGMSSCLRLVEREPAEDRRRRS